MYNGIKEIKSGYTPDNGRIRRPGGGRKAEAVGIPIISIDTKKKELIGNFKRDGTCRRRIIPMENLPKWNYLVKPA